MRWLLICLVFLGLDVVAAAQIDDEPPKPPVLVRPGTGPQIPYDPSRWEFWWFFNRERYLNLKTAMRAPLGNAVESDEPFLHVSQKERQEELLPAVVQGLRDQNPMVRAAAVYATAKTQDEGARSTLRIALRDDQFQVRLATIGALGVSGSSYFLPQLEAVVADDDAELQERVFAAVSIGLIGGSRVAESMRQLLAPSTFQHYPTQLQGAFAYSVGLTRDPDNAPLVRALLADRGVTDYNVRSYLTLSLGKCGDASDLATLVRLLDDSETQLRRSAAIAIGVLCAETEEEEATGIAVAALLKKARKDADLMVRNFAYIALGQVGGQDAAKQLRADLESVTKAHRPFVALALGILGDPESVPVLIDHFEHENGLSYRAALAVSIGLHRDLRAAPALRNAFKQQLEPVFRGYVALALGLVRDAESIESLEKVFISAVDVELIPNAALALGLLGSRESAERIAKRALSESNEFVKQSLTYSLGLIGDRTALPYLKRLLDRKDEQPQFVREYTMVALGMLGDPQPTRAIARITIDSNYTIVSDFLRDLWFIL